MLQIHPTPYFEKQHSKLLKAHPELRVPIVETLELLKRDVRFPSLKTHKLHGKLKNTFSCSVNYEYRIVFTIIGNRLHLRTIGTHDEIY